MTSGTIQSRRGGTSASDRRLLRRSMPSGSSPHARVIDASIRRSPSRDWCSFQARFDNPTITARRVQPPDAPMTRAVLGRFEGTSMKPFPSELERQA